MERYFKYLFNGPFNGPWAGAIHSFLVIPPISRYPTHLPITIKRGFRQTSGQRAFKYLFGEGVGRVRGWDSRGHQYPKKQCRVPLLPKKNSAEYPSSRKKTVQSTPPQKISSLVLGSQTGKSSVSNKNIRILYNDGNHQCT